MRALKTVIVNVYQFAQGWEFDLKWRPKGDPTPIYVYCYQSVDFQYGLRQRLIYKLQENKQTFIKIISAFRLP